MSTTNASLGKDGVFEHSTAAGACVLARFRLLHGLVVLVHEPTCGVVSTHPACKGPLHKAANFSATGWGFGGALCTIT